MVHTFVVTKKRSLALMVFDFRVTQRAFAPTFQSSETLNVFKGSEPKDRFLPPRPALIKSLLPATRRKEIIRRTKREEHV